MLKEYKEKFYSNVMTPKPSKVMFLLKKKWFYFLDEQIRFFLFYVFLEHLI